MIFAPRAPFSLKLLSGAALAFATFSGCAKNNPNRVIIEHEYLEEREIHISFTEDGLILEEFDINQDGHLDNWAYSEPQDRYGEPLSDLQEYTPSTVPRHRLVRREIDLNFDGQVDLIKFYDFKGQVSRENVDSDFTGFFERVSYFNSGTVVRREIDLDENGVWEERRHYVQGKIFRVEIDENQDGKVDYWQFYTDGVLTRAGYDRDGDNIIDEWLQEYDLATLRARERANPED